MFDITETALLCIWPESPKSLDILELLVISYIDLTSTLEDCHTFKSSNLSIFIRDSFEPPNFSIFQSYNFSINQFELARYLLHPQPGGGTGRQFHDRLAPGIQFRDQRIERNLADQIEAGIVHLLFELR